MPLSRRLRWERPWSRPASGAFRRSSMTARTACSSSQATTLRLQRRSPRVVARRRLSRSSWRGCGAVGGALLQRRGLRRARADPGRGDRVKPRSLFVGRARYALPLERHAAAQVGRASARSSTSAYSRRRPTAKGRRHVPASPTNRARRAALLADAPVAHSSGGCAASGRMRSSHRAPSRLQPRCCAARRRVPVDRRGSRRLADFCAPVRVADPPVARTACRHRAGRGLCGGRRRCGPCRRTRAPSCAQSGVSPTPSSRRTWTWIRSPGPVEPLPADPTRAVRGRSRARTRTSTGSPPPGAWLRAACRTRACTSLATAREQASSSGSFATGSQRGVRGSRPKRSPALSTMRSFLVLPSRSEGIGRVVIEAHLRGRPVVGAPWRHSRPRHATASTACCSTRMPDAMADAIVALLGDRRRARAPCGGCRAAGERWLVDPRGVRAARARARRLR